MKIFVKTLKGDRFEIQVKPDDSVADVKKNIEIVLGVTASYPAAEQVLIHKGKVLKDETTVEANHVSEKSTIVVMKRKPASTGTSTASTILKPQVHAAPPYSTPSSATPATETSRPSILPFVTPTARRTRERVPESSIRQILEMVGGAWERDMVTFALYKAYNDIDKALEYLYFGFPVQSDDPYKTDDQTQEPEAPEEADLEQSLDFLRHTPEYEYLRALVHSDPSLLKDILEMIEEQNPPLFRLIQDNKAVFLRLVLEQPQEHQDDDVLPFQGNEPINGGDSGNQVGETKETEVEVVTPDDFELIARLEALGFERGDAAVAYFACNGNLQVAANHLLGYKRESQE